MRSIKQYRLEQIVPIPREEVWNLLSNTNHLNSVIELFKVDYGAVVKAKTGVYRAAITKMLGIYKIRWKEYPFQWVKENFYTNLRVYHNGPIRSLEAVVELYDDERFLPDGSMGTRIVLGANMLSANWFGDIVNPFIIRNTIRKTANYTNEYLRLKNIGNQTMIPQTKQVYDVNLKELERLFALLEGKASFAHMLPLLRDHLLHQGDDEVIEMRPYHWAVVWGIDRDELLKFFLFCTKAGILNLSWHLICPNCRVSKASADTLSALNSTYHCDFCGINYHASLDKTMELCFSVHPAIRKAYKAVFCIGGPAITPHIYSQSFVRQGVPLKLSIPSGLNVFRARVLQTNHQIHFTRQINSSPITLHYNGEGWSKNTFEFVDELQMIEIHNDSPEDIVVVFEKIDWDDIAVTAAKVSTMHEFRRMFSTEILAPGIEVGIESMTFFFSDLLGSTVFYEQVGDAVAYGKVRKHFDFLTEWIHVNDGAIVKTIGDAVMAVFEKPENAVKAALEIQQHMDSFNQSLAQSNEPEIVIKIGIHHGASIAVNSNQRIDYFGRNVNIAARVQGISKGNDVVISSECMDRTEVVDYLSSQSVHIEKFAAVLRGIEDKHIVYQLH